VRWLARLASAPALQRKIQREESEEELNTHIADHAPTEWPWPDSLDALVAASDYHQLVLENEQVRVLNVRIPRGHCVPLHTHRWPSVIYTVSESDAIRRDGEGNILTDTRKEPRRPAVRWNLPMPPHTVENVGTGEIRLLVLELKQAAA